MKLKHFAVAAALLVAPCVLADAPGILPGIADYTTNVKRPKSPAHFTYMPDGESYLLLTDRGTKIVRYETATGKEMETVLDVSHTREASISVVNGFSLSPDGKKMLVYEKADPVWRYSIRAQYYVFEIGRNILKPLSTDHALQEAPMFSPDGRMVAFVSDNNIYIKKLDFNTITAVTNDGKVNEVINGVPDWVYQEEFSTAVSMAWSPDNTTLAYLKYNESQVPMFTFSLYEGVCPVKSEYALYPGMFTYKYPLPGVQNSVVTLHAFDVDTRKTKNIAFEDKTIEYIPRIRFGGNDSSRLMVATLNRDQTRMELYSVNPKSTVVKSILVEQSKAWIIPETYENLTLNDESFVVWSTRSGFTHLYEYSYSGALTRTITSGNWDVTAYYGSDMLGNHYYQSTQCGAVNRVVARIDKKNKVTVLSEERGSASATFSPGRNYFVLSQSSSDKAPLYTLYNNKLKQLRVLVDNSDVTSYYAGVAKKEFITVPGANGDQLNAYIIKPANFDASKKYPLIVTQYSGPGSSSVTDSWGIDWQQYAAMEQGYIVACVDPRGTNGRGYDFMTSVYCHLGVNETADHCAAARYFASLPYIDGTRMGITGWSYGGYETLMSVSASGTPFSAGVAIAPVTSWRYYDSIYTERYMLTPQQNPDGYKKSSPVNLTKEMNAKLLVMSGTADDNVHFSNTVEYMARLHGAGKLCNLMIFPNKDHSIYGCNSRELVYSNLIRHFNQAFGK